jgi:DNA-binding LacI/PurR family transcriptional regulator
MNNTEIEPKIIESLRSQVNKADPTPLYYQIERALEEMIRNKTLLPGTWFRKDAWLAGKLGMHQHTLGKALNRLARKGMVKRARRAGTFVNDRQAAPLPCIGFFYYIEAESVMSRRAEIIQRRLAGEGYDLKIIAYEKDYFRLLDLEWEIGRRGLRGALITPIQTRECKAALLRLEAKRFPYVRFARSMFAGELKAPAVLGNDRQRTRDALAYLRKLGHRKIGLVCAQAGNETEQDFRRYLARRGGIPERCLIATGFSGPVSDWPKMAANFPAAEYLKRNPDVTAILVEGAGACLELMKQAALIGKKVPADLSLLSLSDWEGFAYTAPLVTALRLSNEKLAETAVKFLMGIIAHGPKKREEITLIRYEPVERGSVAPPKD